MRRLLSATMLSISSLAGAADPIAAPGGAPFFPEGSNLPRYETDWERDYTAKNLPASAAARAQRFGTPPPTGPIHCNAEFEPCDGIVMAWEPNYLSTGTAFQVALAQVITSAAGNAVLYLQVDSQSALNSARTTLSNAGIDTANKVQFVIGSNDSIWMRDYGPRYIYEGDVRAIIDHVYNRPRPNDDTFPEDFAAYKKHTRYELNMTHGGGNFHLDAGVHGYATRLINNENPSLTQSAIEQNWLDYQGLDMTILDAFPTSVDSTQHLDMWMIWVSPTKVLVSDWPAQSGTTQDNICDAAATTLAGQGYTVYRVPARTVSGVHYTYTNAMICNNAVAIPSYTNSTINSAGYNAQALAVWQEALPSHTITQVASQSIVVLAGVMHCIVMHVPTNKNGTSPGVYVRSLNEGGVLNPGDIVPIRWSSDDDVAVTGIDIQLSLDGGETWPVTIASNTADDGVFDWVVPSYYSPASRIRVVARDAQRSTGQDANDTDFILNGPQLDTWMLH